MTTMMTQSVAAILPTVPCLPARALLRTPGDVGPVAPRRKVLKSAIGAGPPAWIERAPDDGVRQA